MTPTTQKKASEDFSDEVMLRIHTFVNLCESAFANERAVAKQIELAAQQLEGDGKARKSAMEKKSKLSCMTMQKERADSIKQIDDKISAHKKRAEEVQRIEKTISALHLRIPRMHRFWFFEWKNQAYVDELARLQAELIQKKDGYAAELAPLQAELAQEKLDGAVREQRLRDSLAREERDLALRWERECAESVNANEASRHGAQLERRQKVDDAIESLAVLLRHAELNCPVGRAFSTAFLPTQNARSFLAMGQVHGLFESVEFQFPLVFSLPLREPVLVSARGAEERSQAFTHELVFRLLTSFPAGRIRFTFVDPVGLGSNFAPFLALADHEQKLFGDKVWTKSKEIEEQLAMLERHTEFVIQKYLRDDYSTLEDYNREVGETPEPYRCLIAYGFPEGFSDEAFKRLQSLCDNGSRCGVFLIFVVTTHQPKLREKAMLSAQAHHIEIDTESRIMIEGRWPRALNRACRWTGDGLPRREVLDSIIERIGRTASQNAEVKVDYFDMLAGEGLNPQVAWRASAAEEIRVPLGPSGPGKVQALVLGSGSAQHVLVTGKTGYGKSILLHNIITTGAVKYGPDELQYYLLDFKSGVEFQTYAANRLPHARVIGIESEREFGLAVLQALCDELDRRGALFRNVGADDLPEYRRRTGTVLPRILLVVDEFQMLFAPEDALARNAASSLDRLVRQGRAFGVHVLLATQTLSGSWTLARGTLSQIAGRIAFSCDEADSRLILADDNPAARLLTGKGEAIYNDTNGRPQGNARFQVAWLPEETQTKVLKHLQHLAEAQQWKPGHPPVVFEGNELPSVDTWPEMKALCLGSSSLSPDGWPIIPIGIPVALNGDAIAIFVPQSGANLLVIAQDLTLRRSLLVVGLTALAAQRFAGCVPELYLVDAVPGEQSLRGLLEREFSSLAARITFNGTEQLGDILRRLVELKNQRRQETSRKDWVPVFLVLHGAQQMDALRNDPYAAGKPGAESSPSRLFEELLRDGPEASIHVVAVCDRFANYAQSLDPNRRLLRSFEMRLGLQMPADDSNVFFGSPEGGRLGPLAALYFHSGQGVLLKFRPFRLPGSNWVSEILSH